VPPSKIVGSAAVTVAMSSPSLRSSVTMLPPGSAEQRCTDEPAGRQLVVGGSTRREAAMRSANTRDWPSRDTVTRLASPGPAVNPIARTSLTTS
jgi:hypothetical protein